jgi:hypothetical protein
MSMVQRISKDDQHKLTYDDMNERVSFEEWRCCWCEDWVHADEVIWATEDGVLSTDTGKPYCVSCAPQEKE